jgi:hypothetical protein
MTINGQGYKPTFLRCVEEGYDTMQKYLTGNLEYVNCPYEIETHRYEHDAWWWGADWYRTMVH